MDESTKDLLKQQIHRNKVRIEAYELANEQLEEMLAADTLVQLEEVGLKAGRSAWVGQLMVDPTCDPDRVYLAPASWVPEGAPETMRRLHAAAEEKSAKSKVRKAADRIAANLESANTYPTIDPKRTYTTNELAKLIGPNFPKQRDRIAAARTSKKLKHKPGPKGAITYLGADVLKWLKGEGK